MHEVQDWNDNVSDWKNFGPDVYISAQIRAADVKTKMIFVLGDGKDKGGYDNKKLSSGQKYKIYARAVTEVTSKVGIFHSFVRMLVGIEKTNNRHMLSEPITIRRTCMRSPPFAG